MMPVYVINLDTQPERWDAMRDHLARWPSLDVRRWSATPSDGIEVNEWNGRRVPRDKAKAIAIVRTYRALLRSGLHDGPWIIIQDDIRFTDDPRGRPDSPIHLYGGSSTGRGKQRRWKGDPRYSPHVHPHAFRINGDYADRLRILLDDETRQICESWTPLLVDATYDDPVTTEVVG